MTGRDARLFAARDLLWTSIGHRRRTSSIARPSRLRARSSIGICRHASRSSASAATSGSAAASSVCSGLQVAESLRRHGARCADHRARVSRRSGSGCEDSGLVFSIDAHLFACISRSRCAATSSSSRQLLPGLCSGERIGANAITEAGGRLRRLRAQDDRRPRRRRATSSTAPRATSRNGPVADVVRGLRDAPNPSTATWASAPSSVERDHARARRWASRSTRSA